MKDKRLGHLAYIRTINRTPAVQVIRGEAYLVIDHYVNSTASSVPIKLSHLRHLINNTLTGNGSISMN